MQVWGKGGCHGRVEGCDGEVFWIMGSSSGPEGGRKSVWRGDGRGEGGRMLLLALREEEGAQGRESRRPQERARARAHSPELEPRTTLPAAQGGPLWISGLKSRERASR